MGEVKCQLGVPPMHQCCCQCVYLRGTYEHCTTNPHLRDEMGTCVCGVQTGWACTNPEMDGRIYPNWPEHSCGCELYTKPLALP